MAIGISLLWSEHMTLTHELSELIGWSSWKKSRCSHNWMWYPIKWWWEPCSWQRIICFLYISYVCLCVYSAYLFTTWTIKCFSPAGHSHGAFRIVATCRGVYYCAISLVVRRLRNMMAETWHLSWRCHGPAMALPRPYHDTSWQCHGPAVKLPWPSHCHAMAPKGYCLEYTLSECWSLNALNQWPGHNSLCSLAFLRWSMQVWGGWPHQCNG